MSFGTGRPEALTHSCLMGPDETQVIDLAGQPLAEPDFTYTEYGLAVPKVAEIRASNQHTMAILDTRQNSPGSLLVVDPSFKASGHQRGFQQIWDGDAQHTFGRAHDAERFTYPLTVSASHFAVALHGLGLHISNLRPTNDTMVSGNLRTPNREGGIIDDYTVNAREDLYGHSQYEAHDTEAPYGYYRGHAIIGRNSTTVRDGVYFTTRPRSEAVVVDYMSPELRAAQYEMQLKAYKHFGSGPRSETEVRKALELVNQFTRELMPYDLKRTEQFCDSYAVNMDLVGLSEFMHKFGVCRHQNLLAAVFVESLVETSVLNGAVGVQRNHDIEAHGAHAWAIFKRHNREDLIVDPAQRFVGTRAEAKAKDLWKYDLATD